MLGLGQSILEEGIEQGVPWCVQILLDEGFTKDQIKEKIMKHFDLSEDTAEEYLK